MVLAKKHSYIDIYATVMYLVSTFILYVTRILGIFVLFISSAELVFKLTFSNMSFRNRIRASNALDPDQDRPSVGPDLGLNCLPKGYQQTTKVAASMDSVMVQTKVPRYKMLS